MCHDVPVDFARKNLAEIAGIRAVAHSARTPASSAIKKIHCLRACIPIEGQNDEITDVGPVACPLR